MQTVSTTIVHCNLYDVETKLLQNFNFLYKNFKKVNHKIVAIF